MACSLLNKNTISIINSPTKEFYRMAAIDYNDSEQFDPVTFSEDVLFNSDLNRNLSFVPSETRIELSHSEADEQLSEDHIGYSDSDKLCEFASVNPFDVSVNNSSSVTVLHTDSFSSGSEAVFGTDVVERRARASCDDQPKLTQDVVRAVSLAELFDPVYIQRFHHKSEGYLDSHLEKTRRASRKYVRKSKSYQNNCCNHGNDFKEKLYMHTPMQIDTRRKNSENSTNMLPNSSDVSSNGRCRVQASFSYHAKNNIHGQLSDRNEDSKTSGNDENLLTSEGAISTGHESTNIDQAWDRYQVPLYIVTTDDSTEEKLDASCLQGDWQQLTDEFTDFSDFGNVTSIHHCPTREDDSDTDAEELYHLVKESSDALHLTKLSLAELKGPNHHLRSALLNEPLATCKTNIDCLRDLLEIAYQRDCTAIDTDQLSDLLKQWEDVEFEFLQLMNSHNLSTSKPASDVIIDLSPDDSPDDSASCQKTNLCFTRDQVTKTNSTSSNVCSTMGCQRAIIDRFYTFSCGIQKLMKESRPVLHSTLASIQTIFFVILFLLLISYLIMHSKCLINVMEIRVEPQLRYVIGPPPS